MHIVIVLPRWVGDAVMATPLLVAIRGHLADAARITGVMRPVIADLLEGAGWFDAIVPYERGRDPAHGFRAVARRLRSDRGDVALVLPNSLSSAALVWAGGARRRIGHVGHWRRPLLTDVVPPAPRPLSLPESLLELAGPLGVPPDPDAGYPRLALVTTSTDEAQAEAVLASLYPHTVGPLVILNDGGAHGPSKAWGVDRCVALTRWLVSRLPVCRVLVHCGPGDREAARAVAAGADHPAVQSLADVPELPIGLSKALYRRAALSISSDSGPRHIGAAFGVPTVALVGPIDPLCGRSDPRRCVELRVELPCSPCGRRTCPLDHHDCMRLLSPERVGAAALDLLTRCGTERRAG